MSQWQLQDAKNQFSALVVAALTGEPQIVTRRGIPAVAVLPIPRYERLLDIEERFGSEGPDVLLDAPGASAPSLRTLLLELGLGL